MAEREKVSATPIIKDNTKFLYYIKDGKVFRVPKKQSGAPRGRSEMEYDAKLTQDPDYIYFVDEDGDIARVPRARGRRRAVNTARKGRTARPSKKPGRRKGSSRKPTARKTRRGTPKKK